MPEAAPTYYTLTQVAEILHRNKKWLERIILADEGTNAPVLTGTYSLHTGGHRLWDCDGIEAMRWLLDKGSKSSSETGTGIAQEQSGLETSETALERVLGSSPRGRSAKPKTPRVTRKTAQSESSSTERKRRQRGPMLQPVT